MTFTQSINTCYSKYFTFSGRASRSEYWWFILYSLILSVILRVLIASIFNQPAYGADVIFSDSYWSSTFVNFLLTGIPGIAVMVRRLHDVNKSGWWYFIILTVIGVFFLLYWLIKEGDKSRNNFN